MVANFAARDRLTDAAVARLLSVSKRTLLRWLKHDVIDPPALVVGKRGQRRWAEYEVAQILDLMKRGDLGGSTGDIQSAGRVAKTTTAVTLARSFADKGRKVLLIDTDSQGSIRTILGVKPEFHLADFLIRNMAFRECVVTACPNVDVICSNRDTTEAEVTLSNSPFRELTFERMFSEHESAYDVVLIDVAPSITLSQQCAMVYAQQVLVPVGMETLSLQGAVAAVNAAQALNRFFKKGLNVRTIGLLPVMVDRRLAMTSMVLDSLKQLSADTDVPVLPVIRTDSAVPKAARVKAFLADFDPNSKALADYNEAASLLLESLDSTEKRSDADERIEAKSA